ncbi:MAG: GNAT family N-acetyltransferase [Flavobacteriia bacterium]|nr:GNAT family N-acetyltransferase [Flavobacteriia bacterium]
MIDQITIRAYSASDKNEIVNLIQLNTPQYFSIEEESELIHYLDHELELYYVIEFNSKIVGSGGINFSDDKKIGKISWDILHPEFQGKSLGKKLVQYRIEQLKQIESIQKIIVRTSQLVYKFYEKQGFELQEIIENYWADGFDLYSMTLK